MTAPALARYDAARSYDWNYEHAPDPATASGQLFKVPPCPGNWFFCGLRVGSPLGIAAGPLLNGRWVRHYAALGFDVLTYKTVRSRERACYPMPNLVPVEAVRMTGNEQQVHAADPVPDSRSLSWAVSFGMPSKSPHVWRSDVEATRKSLARDKVLVVSVVATEQPGWTIDDLANDYALCARWAIESGADAVEANFSCPNVCSSDGQLYQHPPEAARCAEQLRSAMGAKPLIVKIGHLRSVEKAAALVEAIAHYADALAMTNSVAVPVVGSHGERLFDDQPRGICGAAIREASIEQTRMVQQVIAGKDAWRVPSPSETPDDLTPKTAPTRLPAARQAAPELIGVGGVFTADDVRRYLVAGARSVHLATAAMVDPTIALRIRAAW